MVWKMATESGQSSPDLEVAALFNSLDKKNSETIHCISDKECGDQNKYQETNLHIYAGSGDIENIEKLVANGSDINAVDESGCTPLAWAANQRQLPAIKCLLKYGAGIDGKVNENNAPLSVAASKGFRDVCNFLLRYGAEVDISDSHASTPLMYAAFNGHDHVVKLLLEHGADLTRKNVYQSTAMDIAHKRGHKKVLTQIDNYLIKILDA